MEIDYECSDYCPADEIACSQRDEGMMIEHAIQCIFRNTEVFAEYIAQSNALPMDKLLNALRNVKHARHGNGRSIMAVVDHIDDCYDSIVKSVSNNPAKAWEMVK